MKFKHLIFLLVLFLVLRGVSAYNVSHIRIVGVSELNGEFKGVTANLTVEIHNGTGRVFVETKPLTQVDTQASARLAKEVACDTINANCSKYDFFYIISSDYEMIGGPSAGAAMTAATIAALQGVEIKKDVFITGTINPSGSIGSVGSILKKAEAAYINGAKEYIIPKGQSMILDEATGEKVNITKLAKKNWNLSIIEVYDISQAYKYLTGYQIKIQKVTNADIASEKYTQIMKSLSESLYKYANRSYGEALGIFNSSMQYSTDIEDVLSQSDSYLSQASESFENNEFYSSSSFSVRSLINSNYAAYLIGYYSNNKNNSYIESKLNKVNQSIITFETLFLTNRKIDSYNDIEIYSVVIDRIREAESILDSARSAYLDGDYNRALYLTAFAEVRKNTAYNWLLMLSKFNDGLALNLNLSNVKTISQERIQESKTYIIYASMVANNQILDGAKSHLKSAIDAFNEGKYTFALFEASKARAEANLAMEARAVTNDTVQSKINELEDSAMRAIKKYEERGTLPILALSYLEFGKTLRYTNPLQSLVYLSYSKEMTQISKDLTEATLGNNVHIQKEVKIEKFYYKGYWFESGLIKTIYLLSTGALFGVLAALYKVSKRK